MDAIDDGLAADAVIARLVAAMRSPPATDPVGGLVERVREIAGDD